MKNPQGSATCALWTRISCSFFEEYSSKIRLSTWKRSGWHIWHIVQVRYWKLMKSWNIAIRIYLIYQENPIDISLSPFLMFLILKQFYALVLYYLWPVDQIVISYSIDSKHDLRNVLCNNLESIAQGCNVQTRYLKNLVWNKILYTIRFL